MALELVAAAALVVLPLLMHFEAPIVPQDEGQILVYADLVRSGAVPNRDFQTFYGPGNPWLVAGAFVLTTPSVEVERALGILYRAGVGLAIVLVIRRRSRLAAALAAAVSGGVFLLAPVTLAAYAWLGALALALFALERLDRGSEGAAGLLAAGALTFRPDSILLVAALAPLVRRLPPVGRRRFFAGFFAGIVPLLVHVLMASPLMVFEDLVMDAVFRTRAGRTLPLSALGAGLTMLLVLATAAALVVLVSGFRVPAGVRAIHFSAGALACAALLQTVQRPDSFHVILGGVTGLAFLPWAASCFAGEGALRRVAAVGAALLPFLAAPALLAPPYIDAWRRVVAVQPVQSFSIARRGRPIPLASPDDVRDVAGALALVEAASRPGERLFVGPRDLSRAFMNETYLYFLLPELRPATRFLEMNPGAANRPGSSLAADLASADIALLSRRFDGWREDNESGRAGSSEPARILNERFLHVGTSGRFDVFRRRASL